MVSIIICRTNSRYREDPEARPIYIDVLTTDSANLTTVIAFETIGFDLVWSFLAVLEAISPLVYNIIASKRRDPQKPGKPQNYGAMVAG